MNPLIKAVLLCVVFDRAEEALGTAARGLHEATTPKLTITGATASQCNTVKQSAQH